MTTYSSTEAESNWAQVMETAQREPVAITRPGRPDLFVLSAESLEEMIDVRKRRAAAVKEFREWAAEAEKHTNPAVNDLTEEEIVRMVHELR